VESASGYGETCVELGCREVATFWVLMLSHRRPVMCERHAEGWKKNNLLEPRDLPEPRDPAEDHLAEVDALRARLRIAEDVCYQAQALLEERLTNADLRVPALRAALRKWTAATRTSP
jgi:hypothetical protein